MKTKIGDRVKITRGDYKDRTGVVCQTYNYNSLVMVDNITTVEKLNDDLEKVEPSIDTLVVGDIIIGNDGDEAKVLVTMGDVFLKSQWNEFDTTGSWYTKSGAKKRDWKVKGQSEDIEELTMEQVCKELGRTVKIKK